MLTPHSPTLAPPTRCSNPNSTAIPSSKMMSKSWLTSPAPVEPSTSPRNDQNEPVFNFGKHKGRPVKEVFRLERSFYSWAMQADFPKNTKDVMTALYYEVYPPKSTH